MNVVLCLAPCPGSSSQGTEGRVCVPVSSHRIVSGVKGCPSSVRFIQVTKCLARCSPGTSCCPLHLAGGSSEAPGGKNEFPKPTVWESVVKQKEVQRFYFPTGSSRAKTTKHTCNLQACVHVFPLNIDHPVSHLF